MTDRGPVDRLIAQWTEKLFFEVMHALDQSAGCDKDDGGGNDFWCYWNPKSGPPCASCQQLRQRIEHVGADALAQGRPPAQKDIRRMDTPENRAFWDSVSQAAKDWEATKPDWYRRIEAEGRPSEQEAPYRVVWDHRCSQCGAPLIWDKVRRGAECLRCLHDAYSEEKPTYQTAEGRPPDAPPVDPAVRKAEA